MITHACKQRVLGQLAVGLDPHSLSRLAAAVRTPRELAQEALIDRVVALEPLLEVAPRVLNPVDEPSNGLGARHVGHLELMFEPLLFGMETGLHVVDGAAVLDGHDATGGEAATVADPVDLVEDRDTRVARSQEVRVQRVDGPDLDGAPRRHQGLGGDLAAEGALALLFGVTSPKGIDLDAFEVQQVNQ